MTHTPEENARQILEYLRGQGFIRSDLEPGTQDAPAGGGFVAKASHP